MPPNKVILLACGSFNPPTNMHLRMFEIARDHLHRMGQHVVIGGIISPVHDAYGKKELESSTHRIQMIKYAIENNDWIKLSDWECKQETWSKTRQVLQHHQNSLNAILQHHKTKNNHQYSDNINEIDLNWIPVNVRNGSSLDFVQIKLLCGGDLLESFGTPGLWADEDIESIVGQHGLIVITRSQTNPLEFIYNSDMLTKYMSNIMIVTEWIRNDVSSTKIRRALRRSESVRYLLQDKVIDYIYKYNLYGSERNKYLSLPYNDSVFLTPSPSEDVSKSSPTPSNCMNICNNNLFSRQQQEQDSALINSRRMSIDMVDSSVIKMNNFVNVLKHPGQAVKIQTKLDETDKKDIKINKKNDKASLVRPACL